MNIQLGDKVKVHHPDTHKLIWVTVDSVDNEVVTYRYEGEGKWAYIDEVLEIKNSEKR